MDKLLAIDFSALPVKDAFTIVRGNGKRKIAVFEDPNCGYCKRFERDLQKVDNVTIYMFLYPILGPDSTDKSRNIWCAKDKGKAWLDWMVRDQAAPAASCDTARAGAQPRVRQASTRSPARRRWCSPTARRVPGAIARRAGRENAGRRQAVTACALPRGASVHYRVEAADLHAHLFRVTLSIDQPAAQQRVSLPVWIPGSYLVREFSKNLQRLAARQEGRAVAVQQLDKCNWQIECVPSSPLVLSYEVYAFDNSVRTAWLDTQRGFFNGTSLCLRVHGQENSVHSLELRGRQGRCGHWEAATGLAAAQGRQARLRHLPGGGLRRAGRLPGGDGRLLERRVQGRRRAAPPGGGRRQRVVRQCPPAGRRAQDLRNRNPLLARTGRRQAPAAQELPVHAQRGGRRLRRAGASQLHRADRLAARPAAAGRAAHERRLRHPAGPDQPRVFPHLERQAPAAGGVHALRLRAARTTRSCCGSSRASPATTTTCCCAAPA